MPPDSGFVHKVAVLGAGVMGAQIAAHFTNANVETLLFELPAKEGDPNTNVIKAIEGLKKMDPGPLSTQAKASYIEPANYEQHLGLLKDCDIVIEAISERVDWKVDLYKKVAPHLGEKTIFASNTSGLSINQLAQALPQNVRARFCGVHFFNPPRYMYLVELIPNTATNPSILDRLEEFLTTVIGKGIVRAKDTPNFIANRIGVFSMLATMHHAQQFGLGFDVVDALTGPLIGRAKSATFRTADVVGLDVFAHVVNTMAEALPGDPWHKYYALPAWLQKLVEQGALGQKTKRGIYQKVDKEIQVLDVQTHNYRPSVSKDAVNESVKSILKNKNPIERFTQLRASNHKQAQFLWAIFRDVFHYCALHLSGIADNARDVDLAIRWGFGWEAGPFEIWQSAGWQNIANAIADDIASGKTMANAPLPAWASDPNRNGVHGPQGSYSPTDDTYKPRSKLPVYQRQLFPDVVLGETSNFGETLFETDAVRMWHMGDDIAILSFKSKMHAIGDDVIDGVLRAVDEAESRFSGLVIWQTEQPFSAGANLLQLMQAVQTPAQDSVISKFQRTAQRVKFTIGGGGSLSQIIKAVTGSGPTVAQVLTKFQYMTQRLKYSMIPTVAAVRGLALGGGCELAMHCDRIVASLESYVGLVEAGVGVIPSGGGCKEITLRAAQQAQSNDVFPVLQKYFETVAMAQVSKSAEHAREMGFLRSYDKVVMNSSELLYVAKAQARALAEFGYRPPLRARNIPVAGKSGIATFKMAMVNMLEGKFISEHDYLIGSKIAEVLCGGEVQPGSLVDEDWLLELERHAFLQLLALPKTQARIEHMLKTGKPLRN